MGAGLPEVGLAEWIRRPNGIPLDGSGALITEPQQALMAIQSGRAGASFIEQKELRDSYVATARGTGNGYFQGRSSPCQAACHRTVCYATAR